MWPKHLVFCLSVCASVTFLNEEFLRMISPWRRWSTKMTSIPLDRQRFVVVHPCVSRFSIHHQLTTLQNTEVQKNGKIWGFLPLEGNRINWSRHNLACKHRPWVYSSIPNLALIGKGGTEFPQMSKFAQNCSFFFPGKWYNKRIQMKFGM